MYPSELKRIEYFCSILMRYTTVSKKIASELVLMHLFSQFLKIKFKVINSKPVKKNY